MLFKLTAESFGKIDRELFEKIVTEYPRELRATSAILYGMFDVLNIKGVLTQPVTDDMLNHWENNGYPEEVVDYVSGLGYAIENGHLVRVIPKVDLSILTDSLLKVLTSSVIDLADPTSRLYAGMVRKNTPVVKMIVQSYGVALEFLGENSVKASVSEVDVEDMLDHNDLKMMTEVANDILDQLGFMLSKDGTTISKMQPIHGVI